MARIKMVDPTQATGKSQELLTALQNNIKSVPNLAKALANSPGALKAWMEFDNALAKGSLNAKLRQEIALAVGQNNGCEYCVSAHTAIGKFAGLTDRQILNSRQGQGTSPKDTAALTFARELLEKRGQVPASSIQALRDQGFTDGEIAEIIGLTELAAAILIIAGYMKPKAGIIGGFIGTLMFFITSTMVITTPGAIISVPGIHHMRYMSFLGLFLFKDVISLGVCFYLISYFGRKAILSENQSQ